MMNEERIEVVEVVDEKEVLNYVAPDGTIWSSREEWIDYVRNMG